MARAAKKETPLTIEEKLAKALVPEDEQPYPVPENWCWTYMGIGFDITSSKRVHKKEWTDEGVPFYRTRELVKLSEHGFVDNDLFISKNLYDEFKEKYGVPKINDLLISGVGTIGVPYIINNTQSFYFKDGNVIWLKNRHIFDCNYIFYLYKSLFMFNQIHDMSAGTTVDTYTIINAERTKVPLPPLPEQQRIVALIESLFADLDAAKEKLQTVLDGFAERRAALLHQAFTGELTREWREENGINDSWNTVRFDEVARVKSNLVDPAEYQNFPHIAPDNVEKKTGKLLDFHTVAEDKVTSGKHRFYDGQILYSKIRPYLSKVVLVDFDGLCSADMYPIESKEQVDIKYLWYYMLSDDFLTQASTAGSRTVLPKINQKELSALSIRITTHPEQKEIVRILDDIFAKESQAKATVESVLSEIDTMKKAILATAFRGGFETNNSSDESAKELLRKVL